MIYLNYAATSGVKPDTVNRILGKFYKQSNAYEPNKAAVSKKGKANVIRSCRESLSELFKVEDPSRIVFCSGATHALNIAISGILQQDDHAIITVFEHNSVLRPLEFLKQSRNISYTVVEPDETGSVDPAAIRNAVKPNTKLIIINHSSNVSGIVQPVTEIGKVAKEKSIPLLVDAAQSAGVIDINVERDGIDMLAFTGHKGLYGPNGIGGLYIKPGIDLEPLIHGGTGSYSDSITQPTALPDKHESGTPNLIGIAALKAGVDFVLKTGTDDIIRHELALKHDFIEQIQDTKGLKIIGYREEYPSTGIISLEAEGIPSNEIGNILEDSFDIICRPGLHCAPLAHKYYGTLGSGTVRFSFGYFTDEEEIELATTAMKKIVRTYFQRKIAQD